MTTDTSEPLYGRFTVDLPERHCDSVVLRRRSPGLTPRSVIEKFTAVQMLDVHVPTTDGRELVLTRY
jgi:hypothetical protein